jgi:hypothetical protein
MPVATVRRALLVAASPLTLTFVAIAAYATLSCPKVHTLSWEWTLPLAVPAATLIATAGMLHAAMTDDERRGALSLTAAAASIALWLQLATGEVF